MNKYITESNFVYIKNFISPERAKELSKQFIEFTKENSTPGDHQVETSSAQYNYIGFLELLCEKTPEVSKFLGETVLPTYSYARVYKQGSTLDRHVDRDACEISLTLHLTGDSEWPIWIQKPSGEEVSLDLTSGDAMMYLGNVAEHWRDKFEGKEYVQVFLHYVRSRGDKSYAYFDKERTPPEIDTKPALPKPIEQVHTKPVDKKIEFLSEYICEFTNLIPDDLCNEILQEYTDSKEWMPTLVGTGVIDKSIRNVDTIGLSLPDVILKNATSRQSIDNRLFEIASKAIAMYNQKWPLAQIQEDSGYELLRYEEGGFYSTHTDSFKSRPRSVSCSFALNDDFEGGEFSFFDKQLTYKVKKGSVLMFPSNFMYPHEILPVTKGTRYAVITWFI